MTTQSIRHLAFFWLANPDSAEDRAKLAAGLETLRAIPEVHDLHIGMPGATAPRPVVDSSWHVSEAMTFDSPAAEAVYQVHPIHKAFIAECGHLWSRVLIYDLADFS